VHYCALSKVPEVERTVGNSLPWLLAIHSSTEVASTAFALMILLWISSIRR
jgi:hypothetical protein